MNEKLTELESALKTAAALSKEIAADPQQARSAFAASIRSAVDHAAELLQLHIEWLAANPPKG